jgi:DNA-directed RNA polymerase specialized sigma24 family protein
VGDLTHQETADRLGVPLGAVLADAIMASGRRGADGLDP